MAPSPRPKAESRKSRCWWAASTEASTLKSSSVAASTSLLLGASTKAPEGRASPRFTGTTSDSATSQSSSMAIGRKETKMRRHLPRMASAVSAAAAEADAPEPPPPPSDEREELEEPFPRLEKR